MVARGRTLMQRSQAPATIRTERLGMWILQPIQRTTTKAELLLARGVVEVACNGPFRIMVPSMTNSPVLLYKHTNLVELTERLTTMMNMIEYFPTDTPDDFNAVPVYKEKVDEDEQIRLHQEI